MKPSWSRPVVVLLASVMILMLAGCASQTGRPASDDPGRTPATGAKTVQVSPLHLVVSLTDGSRVMGETTLERLTLRSPALGKVVIPLDKIRTVKFSPNHESAAIALQNGDHIQGSLGAVALVLRTLIGRVTVPLESTTAIEVLRGGWPVVTWSVLPFPKDSNWPANRGEPALIKDNEILLQGRSVRSQQTFAAPLTIEYDMQLEERLASDGSLDLFLIPPDLPCDRYPKPMINLRLIYSNTGDYGSVDRLDFNRTDAGGGNSTWSDTACHLRAGKVQHLQLQLASDGQIRLQIDGKEIKVPEGFKAPSPEFQVQLLGWQPTNRWHVRNFTVR